MTLDAIVGFGSLALVWLVMFGLLWWLHRAARRERERGEWPHSPR